MIFATSKQQDQHVKLNKSFKEKLIEENKARYIAEKTVARNSSSSKHNSSIISSNEEIADRINQ